MGGFQKIKLRVSLLSLSETAEEFSAIEGSVLSSELYDVDVDRVDSSRVAQ